jgi:hypothetical protein
VSAKVTAWRTSDSTTRAGYRVLPSNGRLEADLIERLEEALQHTSASVASEPSVPAAATRDRAPAAAGKTPGGDASVFRTPLPLAHPANRVGMTPPSTQEIAQQKRAQQLTEQATNLEEILHNQAHPNDLAAVLKTRTPVYAKPAEISEVLFRADAEDEFKVLEVSEGWVHVQPQQQPTSSAPRTRVPLETSATPNNACIAGQQTMPEPQTYGCRKSSRTRR